MHTPVLIVGGGPVGLVASILLSRYGVANTLVERHRGIPPHPRARVVSRRTMEILRGFGIEQRLAEVSLPPDWTRQNIYMTTMCGPEIGRVQTLDFETAARPELSPSVPLMSSQDRIEPVLREVAETAGGATLRFGCSIETLAVDDREVTAVVVERDSGRREAIRADYVIAADGASSGTRERLGIRLEGALGLATVVDVHFRADLHRYVDHRPAPLFWVDPPDCPGVFQPIDGREIWRCQIVPRAGGQPASEYTHEDCARWIRAAVGDPVPETVCPEILSVRPWTMHSAMASRFRAGRIFLAGDAAHVLPPSGGLGMNSGIQGVHNLAWKLAAVCGGDMSDGLLDTYETERRPAVTRNANESLGNSLAVIAINEAMRSGGDAPRALAAAEQYGNFTGLDLGAVYESDAVVGDGTSPPHVENAARCYAPAARPGHRAPHAELRRGRVTSSTLDLFADGFTLLAGAAGDDWVTAASDLPAVRHATMRAFRIGGDGEITDVDGTWERTYGITPRGAVLVRPDGHVAWRATDARANPGAELARVWKRLRFV